MSYLTNYFKITILVATKVREEVLKNCYRSYENDAINTQVKDHIPLKEQKKIRNAVSIKI